MFKVAGRERGYLWIIRPRSSSKRDIGVIGCGQFAFSTLGYAICKEFGNRFGDCFDIENEAKQTFAEFYGIKTTSKSAEDLIRNSGIKYVYIASNHASHADYAIEALDAGKIVYVEKPISVDRDQFVRLIVATSKAEQPIYAGYNRPFSEAIRRLRMSVGRRIDPLTLNCFVSGHMIPADHWYRKPEEGTRVCGNLGHWLDLAVHVLSWGQLPELLNINVTYSDPLGRDDNLAIAISSNKKDLIGITLTSRCEPFEGINENINYQCGNVIAKIDDFRTMTIWNKDEVKKYRFWPKDVGHNMALIQPFINSKRDWKEVVLSSILMLTVKDMVFEWGFKQRI